MSWVVLRQPLRLPQGAAAARVLGTDGTADTVDPELLVNSHQLIHHFRISQWFVLLSVRQNYVVFNESSLQGNVHVEHSAVNDLLLYIHTLLLEKVFTL